MKKVERKSGAFRKAVAFLSSAALAFALVPAFAMTALAEGPTPEQESGLSLKITMVNLDDPEATPVDVKTVEQADLEALAKTDTQSFVFLKKNGDSLTVHTTSKYVPLEALLSDIPAWKPGSTLAQIDSVGEEYIAKKAVEKGFPWPVTYDFIAADQYFYPKYNLDAKEMSNPKLVTPCIPLTMTEAATVTGIAEEATGGPENPVESIRTLFGTTEESHALYGITHNSTLTADIKEFRIGYHIDDIAKATVTLSKASSAYTGKTQKGAVKSVALNGKTLKSGTDYTVAAASGKNAGTYKVTVTGKGVYKGTATASFKIKKASNKVTAKKTKVTKSYKAKKSTKTLGKAKKISLPKTTAKFGTVKYKVSKKDPKKILILSGKKIKVKKAAKKGKTYTIKVKAYVTSTSNYKSASKTITVKVKIR